MAESNLPPPDSNAVLDPIKPGVFGNLSSDVPAAIIVFLVAVPLCLGIALASGAPLFSGIIAGIIGGVICGSLSGSQLGVSGPAAGLAVIVLTAIGDLGAFDVFLCAVVIAGVFQVLLGILKAGVIGYYFPSSVITGMLAGIGIVIFIKQIPHAFGYHGQNTSTFSNIMESVSPGAVLITALSLVVLVLWQTETFKKKRVFQILQGPLVVVAGGILLGYLITDLSLLGESFQLRTVGDDSQMVQLPVAGSLSEFLGQFTLPDFSALSNPAVWMTGATIAIVASLETLLCLEATDKLDPYKRVAPANRELMAQGVGNVASGMIGGLPITQVIVRSSTNIQSGGKTKLSAILHGLVLAVAALAIPSVLNMIPLASLAAILFMVGYKLAKPALFKKMYKLGAAYFIPFAITIAGIVFVDLLVGIGLGLAVAIVYILYKSYRKPFRFESTIGEKHGEPHPTFTLTLAEDVTFIHKARIRRALNSLPPDCTIVIDGSKSIDIDYDVLEIIEDFKIHAAQINIDVEEIQLSSVKVAHPEKQIAKAMERSLSLVATKMP